MRVRSTDYPPTDPTWSLQCRQRERAGAVADLQDSRAHDPTVQGQPAIKLGPDATEGVEILDSAVRVDRGDDAPLADRMNADDSVADGESVTGKFRFDVRWHT
jgi:hypothetical protein